jgi:nucleotide-binding universal stress UspA family protein
MLVCLIALQVQALKWSVGTPDIIMLKWGWREMFKQVLVPLDGSKTAEDVLPYVCEIAANYNTLVVLTRVTEPNISLNECRAYLETAARALRSRLKAFLPENSAEVDIRVLTGNPAFEILNFAGEMACDLIIIANRGASEQGEWPLGSIAGKILRVSDCPVLLVRKNILFPALNGKMLINRIMLPLDGSKLGEAALPLARELGRTTGAEVVLYRVIEPAIIIASTGTELTRGTGMEYGEAVRSSHAKPLVLDYLNRIRESLEKDGVISAVVIGEGYPADRIIDYAELNSIDLITISTHGLSGISRWVLGSVTDKVLHAGNTAVLVAQPAMT